MDKDELDELVARVRRLELACGAALRTLAPNYPLRRQDTGELGLLAAEAVVGVLDEQIASERSASRRVALLAEMAELDAA